MSLVPGGGEGEVRAAEAEPQAGQEAQGAGDAAGRRAAARRPVQGAGGEGERARQGAQAAAGRGRGGDQQGEGTEAEGAARVRGHARVARVDDARDQQPQEQAQVRGVEIFVERCGER